MDKLSEFLDRMKKVFSNMWSKIKEFIRSFLRTLKVQFIKACLKSEKLETRARIYLKTKNRRIKKKQFKWLVLNYMKQ